MNRRAHSTCCIPIALFCTLSAFGQHRIFLELQGANPVDTPADGSIAETVAGAIVTLDAYAEDVDYPTLFSAVQITLPCTGICSGGGAATYVEHSLVIDCRPGTCFVIGGCTDQCWAFDFPYCVVGQSPRTGIQRCLGTLGIVLEDDPPFPPGGTFNGGLCYITTAQYQLSPDAKGDCVIAPDDVPGTLSYNQNGLPIPFTTTGITLRVPTGACCSPVAGCVDALTNAECQLLAPASCRTWTAGADCASIPCGCSTLACCDDANVCTCDGCTNGTCSNLAGAFGDTDCSGGPADLDDILCTLRGFSNRALCANADLGPNCTSNGLVNLDDILLTFAAFGGATPCGCD